MNEDDPLYYFVRMYKPYTKQNVYRVRFLLLKDALEYARKKTGRTEVKDEGKKFNYTFVSNKVKVFGGKNFKDFSERLKNQQKLRISSPVKSFIKKKVLKFNCPDSVFYDIMRQSEPMDREIRIMKYKLDNEIN